MLPAGCFTFLSGEGSICSQPQSAVENSLLSVSFGRQLSFHSVGTGQTCNYHWPCPGDHRINWQAGLTSQNRRSMWILQRNLA